MQRIKLKGSDRLCLYVWIPISPYRKVCKVKILMNDRFFTVTPPLWSDIWNVLKQQNESSPKLLNSRSRYLYTAAWTFFVWLWCTLTSLDTQAVDAGSVAITVLTPGSPRANLRLSRLMISNQGTSQRPNHLLGLRPSYSVIWICSLWNILSINE